jgi:hypothetical protein
MRPSLSVEKVTVYSSAGSMWRTVVAAGAVEGVDGGGWGDKVATPVPISSPISVKDLSHSGLPTVSAISKRRSTTLPSATAIRCGKYSSRAGQIR